MRVNQLSAICHAVCSRTHAVGRRGDRRRIKLSTLNRELLVYDRDLIVDHFASKPIDGRMNAEGGRFRISTEILANT